ncbi:hypothetical protein LJ737_19965 [Hymenobacter sp. 15J16-1T3B]|uniref:hypothetical protein n=1 Tax=Hymenobacter sp. 15J16-1T3B TaxID=2886941 RepID=UPI001D1239F7|nr:hypothetical protein [Hymenobacter sp. 15J16-1T3B]MCC3159529.1 hypothetical protein [Hymenobacter sp. 15J16-1T3B]
MARSLATIRASLDAAQAAQPALAPLNSPSATSMPSLWKNVVAFCSFQLETLWDVFRAEVDAIIDRARPGTPAWYADQAYKFQLGDTLTVDDNGIRYPAGSTGARIITRAAAKESDANGVLKLFVKVAKDGTAPGTLAPLSDSERVQVQGYFDRIRFAGTRLEVVSRAADRLQVFGQVYYDPLLSVDGVKAAVAASVRAYLGRLEFDGLVYVAQIEDAIQAVAGVKDVRLTDVKKRVGSAAAVAITRVYETEAGYITEDAAPLDFATTLQFLPHGA